MVKGGVFIGLGSNLGDREANLRGALEALDEQGRILVLARSSLHETAPVGGPAGQEPYLNAVAEIATDLPPRALLGILHEIERRFGRLRVEKDGPRTLDLDLLVYQDQAINEPDLHVPHPRLWERSFVLAPLAELCDLSALRRTLGCSAADPAAHLCPGDSRTRT